MIVRHDERLVNACPGVAESAARDEGLGEDAWDREPAA
jgi:hypothetical protein